MPRRDSKPEIEVPRKVTFSPGDGADRATGWIVKLSVVGVEVESLQPPPAASEVRVWTELVDGEGELSVSGRVQWATASRFGVLFGPLGARETHVIVRATRRPAA
ncbi:MAG: PilZ domain-containing protein [Polyangiaceae bacterium]